MLDCSRCKQLCLALAIMAVWPTIAPAQTPTALSKTPTFEVASIRQNKTNNGRWRMNFTLDGLSAFGVSLQYVIHDAYGIYDDRLWSGGPPWLNSEKFDIEAKFDSSEFKELTLEQRRAMLQQLLADRFKLVLHHEAREFPLYALVLAKNGPKLQESKPENIQHSRLDGGAVCLIPRSKIGVVAFQGCSIHDLVSRLSSSLDVGRTVVDRTGLASRYDFELHWMPDRNSTTAPSELSGPSIFTALQEQLGLKLESTKGPLDTIVIDHAEMPSEN